MVNDPYGDMFQSSIVPKNDRNAVAPLSCNCHNLSRSNPRSSRRTIAMGFSKPSFFKLSVFQSSIVPKNDRNDRWDPIHRVENGSNPRSSRRTIAMPGGMDELRRIMKFQSSIVPKNDRNSSESKLSAGLSVPILDRPEERSQCSFQSEEC